MYLRRQGHQTLGHRRGENDFERFEEGRFQVLQRIETSEVPFDRAAHPGRFHVQEDKRLDGLGSVHSDVLVLFIESTE